MFKWLLHKVFDRFAVTADYDTTYLHEVTDVSAGAAVRYFGLPLLSQMSDPAPGRERSGSVYGEPLRLRSAGGLSADSGCT